MEELKNVVVRVELGDNSLGVLKGYGYVNKEGKQRYSYNDTYYVEDGNVSRKVVNERGEFYYKVELIDIVIETFLKKDGTPGQKTYPLTEVPYLCESAETASEETLKNYLAFKLHR